MRNEVKGLGDLPNAVRGKFDVGKINFFFWLQI